MCSGPYQVESYRQGVSVTLTRNQHWDQASDPVRTAGPDRIAIQFGQNDTVTAQRLISDSGADRDAFGASFVPPAQLAQIEQNPAAKRRLATSEAGPLQYLALNVRRPALRDLRVRQAVEYAVDKRSVQVAAGGPLGGVVASTLITPGIPGRVEYNLYPADPTGDVAKAKGLLSAAGHAGDLSLSLVVTNDPQSLAVGQAIQQGLSRAGITVRIKAEDADTWFADVTGDSANYDMTVEFWDRHEIGCHRALEEKHGTVRRLEQVEVIAPLVVITTR